MFRLAVVVVAVAMVMANPLDLNEEWKMFKTRHNKQYETTQEMQRRAVWESNLQIIEKHNLAADRGEHSYWLGMNEYADLTTEEFVRAMNGYKMTNSSKRNAVFMAPLNVKDLPTEVDWRQKGYVTPVKNQGMCGSCWAFSSTGSLEGQHFRATGSLVSLSEQNLVDCSKPEGNMGCGGGLMDYAFEYIKTNDGIDTEMSYPYKGKDGRCMFKPSNVGATDSGFVDIPSMNEKALQQAVGTIGPISVAMDASLSSFHLYKTGVYEDPKCSSVKLDHGVLAVGYGTSSEGRDYWMVKNSWGDSWGMSGYFMMARNNNNQCGIATKASYPTV